jgi:hypothetical protein
MINISAKVRERLTKGIRRFQPLLIKAQAADINESDTVTIIVDMLSEVFGYDKFENITSEFAIKKTYCDIAIKLGDRVPILLECKAAGIDLKNDHIRQATNYSANSGIEWVVLTNGVQWKIYKIIFAKPVDAQLVYEFSFLDLSAKKQGDLEMLYYLCIEAFAKSNKVALDELHEEKQVMNRYIIGQVVLTETVIDSVRRYLRKLYPDVRADSEDVLALVKNEVLKREVIEGESADDAKKAVAKAEKKVASAVKPKTTSSKE